MNTRGYKYSHKSTSGPGNPRADSRSGPGSQTQHVSAYLAISPDGRNTIVDTSSSDQRTSPSLLDSNVSAPVFRGGDPGRPDGTLPYSCGMSGIPRNLMPYFSGFEHLESGSSPSGSKRGEGPRSSNYGPTMRGRTLVVRDEAGLLHLFAKSLTTVDN